MAKLPGSENGWAKLRYRGADVSTTTWMSPQRYNYKFSARHPEFFIDRGDLDHFLSYRLSNGEKMFEVVKGEEKAEQAEAETKSVPEAEVTKHYSEREDTATEKAWQRIDRYALPVDQIEGTGADKVLSKGKRITVPDVEKFIDTLDPLVEERATPQAITEAEKLGIDVRMLLFRIEEPRIGVKHIREFQAELENSFSPEAEDGD